MLEAMVLYFDSECTIPAVKREQETQLTVIGRDVDVIKYYKLIDGKCKQIVESAVLNKVEMKE